MATNKTKKYVFGNTNILSSKEVRDTREIVDTESNFLSHS
jgi:hypothetical protein